MKKILLLHGPNLNKLGSRDSEHYGTLKLLDLENTVRDAARAKDIEIIAKQSNHEGVLIDTIQEQDVDGIIINPGALTHYSYALHDAIVDASVPTIEVHLSDIHNREPWRAISVTAPACIVQIGGKGVGGYTEALEKLALEI